MLSPDHASKEEKKPAVETKILLSTCYSMGKKKKKRVKEGKGRDRE